MKFLGKIEEAIEDYSKAIEINPQYSVAYNNRGLYSLIYHLGKAFNLLGRNHLAHEDYSKAIEINPQCDDAYNNRGLFIKSLSSN